MMKKITKIFNNTTRIILRTTIEWHLHFPLVCLYSRKIEMVKPKNNFLLESKPGILAIKERYFRGDLEILANSGEFRVYRLPAKWQWLLLRLYWADLDEKNMSNYFLSTDEKVVRTKKRLQKSLAIFLKSLFKKMKIDCIIGANFNYIQDYDFGKAAKLINIPYIVIQRENLVASKATKDTWRQRARKVGRLDASAIMVYNRHMKQILELEGVSSPDRIHVVGCLRMDDFISKIKNPENSYKKCFSRATLFSFNHHTCIFGLLSGNYFEPGVGLSDFFEHVHCSFARLALDMPDKEFVIKVKKDIEGINAVNRALRKNDILPESMPNLLITETADPSSLIMSSDVVSGFGSMTILESAVAGKPVIIPFFDEAAYKQYEDYIIFREDFKFFKTATSPTEYQRMIKEHLATPCSEVNPEHIRLFEEYVSPFDTNAATRYVKIIKDNILKSKNESM